MVFLIHKMSLFHRVAFHWFHCIIDKCHDSASDLDQFIIQHGNSSFLCLYLCFDVLCGVQDANECWVEIMRSLQQKLSIKSLKSAEGQAAAASGFIDQYFGGEFESEYPFPCW
jgi:hypothetical protein